MVVKECGQTVDLENRTHQQLVLISNKYVRLAPNTNNFLIEFRHLKIHGIKKYKKISQIKLLGVIYPSGRIIYHEIKKVDKLPKVMVLYRI